jgi:hypothetical protein
MANSEHLAPLQQGVEHWNKWRENNPDIAPDLQEADISSWANLSEEELEEEGHDGPYLPGVNLGQVNFRRANLCGANLRDVDLSEADLRGANLSDARLSGADLSWADLHGANLRDAHLSGASLREADLSWTILVNTELDGATLADCSIYGISAWNVHLKGATQLNLRITPIDEPAIHVDNLEVAQFVYLLLKNPKIRDVIDTIGKKGVLLLGRFTAGRITILEKLQKELRNRDLVPMVFNFDKPDTKDFTETIRVLAGMSRFVIADITNPRSAPLELQATIPEYMIPFVPIIQKGEEPFAMFTDLWIKHREWVLDPIRYSSLDRLVEVLDSEVIKPAEARFNALLARKAEELRIKDV